jgi:transposase
MHEAVEDGVDVGWIADHLMPIVDRNLAGQDCRAAAIAFFEYLIEVATGVGIERIEAPIIENKELGAGWTFLGRVEGSAMGYEELDDPERRFTTGFAEEAVGLAQTSGRPQREIAGDHGIGLSALVGWIGRSREGRAIDPAAAQSEVTAALKRLRRENETLRQERDILKKASAFCAREGSR